MAPCGQRYFVPLSSENAPQSGAQFVKPEKVNVDSLLLLLPVAPKAPKLHQASSGHHTETCFTKVKTLQSQRRVKERAYLRDDLAESKGKMAASYREAEEEKRETGVGKGTHEGGSLAEERQVVEVVEPEISDGRLTHCHTH